MDFPAFAIHFFLVCVSVQLLQIVYIAGRWVGVLLYMPSQCELVSCFELTSRHRLSRVHTLVCITYTLSDGKLLWRWSSRAVLWLGGGGEVELAVEVARHLHQGGLVRI